MWNFWCPEKMFLSKYNNNKSLRAFSLPEVVVALMILALISSTVLVAINRYSELAIDRQLRLEAFYLVRENMENLLASDSVEETLEYSSSDLNPNIHTENVVKAFYEPQTERMWIRAVCSASYTDSQDQEQTIEFTHWVTDLSAEQMLQVIEAKEQQKQELEEEQEEWEEADEEKQESQESEPDEEPDEGKEPALDDDKPFDWLPDEWNDMSREEKLNWLLQSLKNSQRRETGNLYD
jgi:prepilin-type N-terminal cleavage/methylation domain-containing protein